MEKWLLTIICLLVWTATLPAQVAVIAHKSVPIDQIDKARLLDLYLGEIKKWEDGQPVVLFDLKQKDEARKAFYKFLGKSSSRMKSIWIKNLLSGEGDPPESIKSQDDLLRRIASTAGAIGFIKKENVSDDVKVLVLIEK